jgi:hypothetical protein
MQPLEFEVLSPQEPWDPMDPPGPARQEPRYPARHGAPARPGAMPTPDEAIAPWNGALAPGNGNPLSVVARFLTVADYEAAAITQQASYQAAMITRQVAYEATEIREAARREAAQITEQAAAQAAAMREAAEQEAADARTAVVAMQTELGELATRIADTFPNLAVPRIPPIERPAVSPAAHPSSQPQAPPRTSPAARPTGRPVARPAPTSEDRPAGSPGTRPATRPTSGRGRQVTAMRLAAIATSALFLVAVVTGVMEIHQHGFAFFVFRSAGTGETRHSGLNEDQGPGQPDAPKPPTPSHEKARPSPNQKAAVHHGH